MPGDRPETDDPMKRATLLTALLLLAAAGQAAWADNPRGRWAERREAAAERDRGRDEGRGRGEDRGRNDVTAGQAAERVRRETGGRVLAVEEGGSGYRVRVLTPGGEVRSVRVPRGR